MNQEPSIKAQLEHTTTLAHLALIFATVSVFCSLIAVIIMVSNGS